MIRNNDLEEKIHILETAEEWPFLKEAVAPEADGAVGGEEQQERPQERLLCDLLMGDPFYYRVRYMRYVIRLHSVVCKVSVADEVVVLFSWL